MRKRPRYRSACRPYNHPVRLRALLILTFVLCPLAAAAQSSPAVAEQAALKQLTLEELLDLDVTTAARRPDSIRATAAPVQVLTRDDLHRSGIRYLAEAFRLADAMYVGRFDGRTWIVNARGLNINGANKMQVMIDGRSIYSPLFSGVFWNAQDVLIEDIDRIEIIRGPGASLWGANAVHGIINVITRRAIDTQGTYVMAGSGNEHQAIGELRQGGAISDNAHYRVYAKYGFRDAQSLADGESAEDPMRRSQVGGRYDRTLSPAVEFSVQGDVYVGRLGLLQSEDTDINGGNLLGRLSHRTDRGAFHLTTYYDRVSRRVPGNFGERRNTFDIDVQRDRSFGTRHLLVLGGGYRASSDDTDVTPIVFFDPKQRTTHLFNVFAQDEIALGVPGLSATAGTRLEHNSYTGWELQPTGRIAWTRQRRTIWGAVSRAVRLPTRFDSDIRVTAGQPFVVISGNPNFRPERMIAYEGGVRAQPLARTSFDVAVFHNRYDDLRSQNLQPTGLIEVGNDVEGHSSGIELGSTWEVSTAARLHGSYTWLTKDIHGEPGSADITGGEGNDPSHMATLRLFTELRPNLRFNFMSRYISALTRPRVAGYAEADLSIQWDFANGFELALHGQNLLHDHHPEFSSGQPNLEEYDRSVYVALAFRGRR